MKKFILAGMTAAALVIGALAATSSPGTSTPSSDPVVTKKPVPGAVVGKTDYRVWYNGECKVFSVPAPIMDVTVNGKTERVAVPDQAAVDQALGPINPKLHRPPTPAEGAACAGPMGPPSVAPDGSPVGAPAVDLNEACARANKPPGLSCP